MARTSAGGGLPAADETPGVLLLGDIRELFDERSADRLTSEEIVEDLAAREDRPWPEWGRQRRPITKTALARLLRPYSIVPGTIRLASGATAKGYYRKAFEDAFRRYLPEGTRHDVTSGQDLGVAVETVPSHAGGCDGSGLSRTGQESGVCRRDDSEGEGPPERGPQRRCDICGRTLPEDSLRTRCVPCAFRAREEAIR